MFFYVNYYHLHNHPEESKTCPPSPLSNEHILHPDMAWGGGFFIFLIYLFFVWKVIQQLYLPPLPHP